MQDVEALQAAIALMAPHTRAMSQSQQARLVAAVGAAGAAEQLSALTVTGTTPLLPSAAMLAGAPLTAPCPPPPSACATCCLQSPPKSVCVTVEHRPHTEDAPQHLVRIAAASSCRALEYSALHWANPLHVF